MSKPGFTALVILICLVVISLLSGIGTLRLVTLFCMPFLMMLPVFGIANLLGRRPPFAWSIYALWSALWCGSVLIECYLSFRYGLQPQSRQVVESLVNAPASEAREYAASLPLPFVMATALSAGLAWALVRLGQKTGEKIFPTTSPGKGKVVLAVALIALPLIAHKNVIVMRADPVTFWPSILREGRAMQEAQTALTKQRLSARDHISEWKPIYTGPAQKTFVLVLGESSNRWDWSLYGYPRKTTPNLDAMRDHLLVFEDVISSYGNTLNEMTRILTSATKSDDESWRTEPSIITLAKQAGYKVFWLSNQSFVYANAMFGEDADVFRLVYDGRVNRHDDSHDEKLLPELSQALQDPAPLKFIVLHTLGSHESYAARYPDSFAVFNEAQDAVSQEMADNWFWIRAARNNYDNSILYTDYVLSRAIGLVSKIRNSDSSLLYLSDHAQDVGHLTASFGHQFFLESGFTVPVILWRNRPDFPTASEKALTTRPYQSDVMDWTLLSLLDISTAKDRPELNLVGPGYQPQPREIAHKAYIPGKSHRVEK